MEKEEKKEKKKDETRQSYYFELKKDIVIVDLATLGLPRIPV